LSTKNSVGNPEEYHDHQDGEQEHYPNLKVILKMEDVSFRIRLNFRFMSIITPRENGSSKESDLPPSTGAGIIIPHTS
jgi:hypothetical protein